MKSFIDGYFEDQVKDDKHIGTNNAPLWFNFNWTIPTSLRSYTEDREEIQDSSVLFHLVANRAPSDFLEVVLNRICDHSFVDQPTGLSALSFALVTNQRSSVQKMIENASNTTLFYSVNMDQIQSRDWRSEE